MGKIKLPKIKKSTLKKIGNGLRKELSGMKHNMKKAQGGYGSAGKGLGVAPKKRLRPW